MRWRLRQRLYFVHLALVWLWQHFRRKRRSALYNPEELIVISIQLSILISIQSSWSDAYFFTLMQPVFTKPFLGKPRCKAGLIALFSNWFHVAMWKGPMLWLLSVSSSVFANLVSTPCCCTHVGGVVLLHKTVKSLMLSCEKYSVNCKTIYSFHVQVTKDIRFDTKYTIIWLQSMYVYRFLAPTVIATMQSIEWRQHSDGGFSHTFKMKDVKPWVEI